MLGVESAAAVGAGQHFQQMAVGVVEVNAAAVVPVVDAAKLAMERVGPVGQPPRFDAFEDLFELRLGNLEGEMARGDLAVVSIRSSEVSPTWTTVKWPSRRAGSRPRISVMNRAVSAPSWAWTMVWLRVTAIGAS